MAIGQHRGVGRQLAIGHAGQQAVDLGAVVGLGLSGQGRIQQGQLAGGLEVLALGGQGLGAQPTPALALARIHGGLFAAQQRQRGGGLAIAQGLLGTVDLLTGHGRGAGRAYHLDLGTGGKQHEGEGECRNSDHRARFLKVHAPAIIPAPLAMPEPTGRDVQGANMVAASPETPNAGTLHVVATPIGNLADISARALQVLAGVDAICAEDTRHTRQLLSHHRIERPLVALHEHNEAVQAEALVERLRKGESLALVSDAGTPLISDPGFRLVRAAREAGLRVSPVPGPSAVIAALSVAGLPSDRFCFEGFLPAKPAARASASRDWPPSPARWCSMKAPIASRPAWPTWSPCSAKRAAPRSRAS